LSFSRLTFEITNDLFFLIFENRTKELKAYQDIINAFRAQGDLNDEKRKTLISLQDQLR
jgi:hypothetical protein